MAKYRAPNGETGSDPRVLVEYGHQDRKGAMMSDHPTTFHAEPIDLAASEWQDSAALHRRDAGESSDMLRGFDVIRKGTFAELVRFVMMLPAEDRHGLVIQKLGDRVFSLGEIEALARRDDFPRA